MRRALSVVFVCLLLWGCGAPAETGDSNRSQIRDIPVSVQQLKPAAVTGELTLYGTLQSAATVTLRVDFSAPVQSVLVEEGQRVSAWQPLLRFDMTKFELKHRQLQHRLRQASHQLDLAQNNHVRMRKLQGTAGVSRQQLEQSAAAFESSRQSVLILEQELALLLSDLAKAQLISPAAGIVRHRHIEPDEQLPAYSALFDLDLDNKMYAVVYANEQSLPFIRVGAPGRVKIGSEEIAASVFSIAGNADQSTGMYEIKLVLDNPELRFKPGQSSEVAIDFVSAEKFLTLPETALTVRQGEHVVYRVEGKQARLQPVTVKYLPNRQLQVVDGLESSDLIVVEGSGKLTDGSQVSIEFFHD